MRESETHLQSCYCKHRTQETQHTRSEPERTAAPKQMPGPWQPFRRK
jgi:hypothetical protein